MEQFLTSTLGSLGVTGLGYFFMYILLKHNLESGNKTIAAVDKLCDKIDELVKSYFILQQNSSESASQAAVVYAQTKEQYEKIDAKIDHKMDITNNGIEEIKALTARIFDKMQPNIRLGQILVSQGTITQEQLDEALKEQKKYS